MSITVAPQVNEKTRQKHDNVGPAHRDSYARRTAAERIYASLADPSVGGIRRGWCRLFGRTRNTLMYALAVVVRNVRILDSFERRKAQEVRAHSIGPKRSRRRRHHSIPRTRRSSRCSRSRQFLDGRHRSRAARASARKDLHHPYFVVGRLPEARCDACPKPRPCHTPHA